MQHPQPDETVTQPKRQGTIPSHLLDYDLSGPGSQRQFNTPIPQNRQEAEQESLGAEVPSRATTPISQDSAPDQGVLLEKGGLMFNT